MQQLRRIGRAGLRLASSAIVMLVVSVTLASAQAWVPPSGTGSVTIAFQNLDYSGHRVTDGTFFPIGGSIHNRIDVEVDYAITDRLSIAGSLPFVWAKYTDPNPLPPFVPFLPVDDCRCWQSGWTDLGFTARYNLVNDAVAFTPSLSVGVPSHEYNFQGEAALGERLREVRIAVDVGRRLDAITPRLSVEGRYSYAFVERVIDVPNNRSNAAIESGFLITRRLATRLVLSWQRVHGGLRLGSPSGEPFVPPGEVNTPERLFEHDRLLRDNNFRLGVGVAYSMQKIDVFASYLELLRGSDSHGGRAITVGLSWPFELGVSRANP